MPNPSLITVVSFTHHIFECLYFIFLSEIRVFCWCKFPTARAYTHHPKSSRLPGVYLTFWSLSAVSNVELRHKGTACLTNYLLELILPLFPQIKKTSSQFYLFFFPPWRKTTVLSSSLLEKPNNRKHKFIPQWFPNQSLLLEVITVKSF